MEKSPKPITLQGVGWGEGASSSTDLLDLTLSQFQPWNRLHDASHKQNLQELELFWFAIISIPGLYLTDEIGNANLKLSWHPSTPF